MASLRSAARGQQKLDEVEIAIDAAGHRIEVNVSNHISSSSKMGVLSTAAQKSQGAAKDTTASVQSLHGESSRLVDTTEANLRVGKFPPIQDITVYFSVARGSWRIWRLC